MIISNSHNEHFMVILFADIPDTTHDIVERFMNLNFEVLVPMYL